MYITEKNLLRQHNNFDFFRLFAAVLVFVSHSFGVRGMPTSEWLYHASGQRYLMSEIGLIIFFSMSGFLVCRSLMTTQTAKQYLKNRFLRIWPAFFVCNMITVFVLGIWFTSLPVNEFLPHPQTLNYLIRNITLISGTHWLPGVFENSSVNASIWTIPIEVRLYILLLLVLIIARLRFRQSLLIFTIIAWLGMIIIPAPVKAGIFKTHQLHAISLGLYFMSGACFYLYKEKIPLKLSIWLALLIYWIVLLIWFPTQLKKMQHPFFVYTFLWMALRWPKIPFFKADISYGFYLYASPLQKLIQLLIGSSIGFAAYLFISGACIALVACLSWWMIEKKALSLKYKPLKQNGPPDLNLSQEPEHQAYRNKQC